MVPYYDDEFFAEAEVALLSVRHSRLARWRKKDRPALRRRSTCSPTGRMLSVTQVGRHPRQSRSGLGRRRYLWAILVSALPSIASAVTAEWLHAACFLVCFLIINVVFGEVVPKNLSIARADVDP